MGQTVHSALAIFDMDGTLFDTCGVNFESYRMALMEAGVVLDENYFNKECFGKNYRDFLPPLLIDRPDLLESVHKRKIELYHSCIGKARKNKALFDYIVSVGKNTHIALVTTASKKNVMEILQYFDAAALFELILTQEDLTRMKPDPQGFLMAMEHFGAAAQDTVIFEDSDVGIEAAMRSGASVLRVMRF